MQVKLIETENGNNGDDVKFENEINAFIKGKNVVDIKYTTDDDWYSALILYHEPTEEELRKQPIDSLKLKEV